MSADTLWYKDAVFYELHVKAFQDSSQDGVGDFRETHPAAGLRGRAGTDVIWLLRFYPSFVRDEGYDIADYDGRPSWAQIVDLWRPVQPLPVE